MCLERQEAQKAKSQGLYNCESWHQEMCQDLTVRVRGKQPCASAQTKCQNNHSQNVLFLIRPVLQRRCANIYKYANILSEYDIQEYADLDLESEEGLLRQSEVDLNSAFGQMFRKQTNGFTLLHTLYDTVFWQLFLNPGI